MRELDNYFRDRNINDIKADKIEEFYHYLKLSTLKSNTVKILLLDIMNYYGHGFVVQVLKKVNRSIRGKAWEKMQFTEIPKFKEEYALRYLNTLSTERQIIHILVALLDVIDINQNNFAKFKEILRYLKDKLMLEEVDRTSAKIGRKIINYV